MVNFDAAPNKVADIELETTAKYQPRANLDIAFSSMDRESAILKFKITQNKLPLSIGNSNVKTHILLVHQNGSKVYAPLTITDPLNGVAQYKIESDMLKLPGKVTGQVYVTRRGKDIPDSSYAVVTERIFNFTIEKSLAWSFDGETKLNYIVEIDELMKTLNDRITSAIRAVENVEDYVSIVETAKINGLSDIEIAKTNSIADLNRLTNEKKEEIRSLGSEYISNVETIKNEVDAKIYEFNSKGVETKESAIQRAIATLNEAKLYTESISKNARKTLFTGDIRARDSVFAISESYKNFSYLLVRYRYSGGGKTVPIHIDTDKKMPIQDFNMTDAAGDNPKMNEMGLIFTSDTEIKVTHNNSFDIKVQRNLYDDNDMTIKEIIGVR